MSDIDNLVLNIEVSSFKNEDERKIIQNFLKSFVDLNIHLEDNKDTQFRVCVTCSAIRKAMAMQSDGVMHPFLDWFKTKNKAYLVELAKMSYRNYEIRPDEKIASVELSSELFRLFDEYKDFDKEKESAISMLSVEALLCMRHTRAEKAMRIINEEFANWYKELLYRRMLDIKKDLERQEQTSVESTLRFI